MRLSILPHGVVCLLSLAISLVSAVQTITFEPPKVFRHTNVLRTIDLTKPYVKETIAAIVENTSQVQQSEYYLTFSKDVVPHISSIEAKDKKGELGSFEVARITSSLEVPTQLYRVVFNPPLKPSETLTLQVTYTLTSTLHPLPDSIAQTDPQFLVWSGSKYLNTPYPTEKQKTKLRFPSADIVDFTKFPAHTDGTSDPAEGGNALTYGPYNPTNIAEDPKATITVRYDYTAPIIHVNKLERDLEISHWGGNLATEERYSITNTAAQLKNQFSRAMWTARSYYQPSAAIKSLTYPLHPGSADVYYTDEIGNVTTSRFRSSPREAHLQLMPRFPVFGGWNYTFVVGWNNDLGSYLRSASPSGDGDYVLRVPFLQGPTEPVVYEKFELRIILPEGATDVKYSAPIPVKEERMVHHTYMDTLGRATLKLSAENLVDELRGKEIIVTYKYAASAALRKPLTVAAGVLALFMATALLSRVNTNIKG